MLRWRPSTTAGFPHSDIHGSMLVCSSPWLFAAYHVFLRLLVPRHPPYALISLIIFRIGSFRYDSLTSAWCLVSTFWNCSRLHITALCFFLLVFSFLREFTRYAVFKVRWWAQVDSNHRPHAYQACALTSWAISPLKSFDLFGVFNYLSITEQYNQSLLVSFP